MATTAYIGIGSNLGDREANIAAALKLLDSSDGVRVVRVSSLYETEPVGYTEQGPFLNAAAELETTLSPHGLLAVCRYVEDALGRVRTVRWGPRTIDLDVLLFGDAVVDTEELTVPHPLMHTRAFVLIPLAEIAPDAVHPALGRTIRELLDEVKA